MEKSYNLSYYSPYNFKEYKPYTYKGIKNKTILPEFVDICKKTQEELIEWLPKKLKEEGYEVIVEKGFIYAKGTIPILLTAHMDTVHTKSVKDFYESEDNGKHILASPQGIGGDDRCGIYMILEIIKTHKCSILFCEDEEIGGEGSKIFCKTKYIDDLSNMHYLIELDRMDADDAVFYDCDNPEFTDFITKYTGYKESYGSFSDISYLAPACGVAAVNLSCGYYHAHTLKEEVVIEDMLNTIEVVKNLLSVESKQYEYIEYKYAHYSYPSSNYYGRYINYDDYYDDYKRSYYDNQKNNYKAKVILYVYVKSYEDIKIVYANSRDEAWGKFFLENTDICFNDILDYFYE